MQRITVLAALAAIALPTAGWAQPVGTVTYTPFSGSAYSSSIYGPAQSGNVSLPGSALSAQMQNGIAGQSPGIQAQTQVPAQSSQPQYGAPAVTPAPVAGEQKPKSTEQKTGDALPALSGAVKTATVTASPYPRNGATVKGSARAVDGATFRIGESLLHASGVRTPVVGWMCRGAVLPWSCGDAAKTSLDGALAGQTVVCHITDDTGGAQCTIGLDDLSKMIVRSGYGITTDPALTAVQREARADSRGIWNNRAR
jgi:endonuclease YncB( thermonuclease family)